MSEGDTSDAILATFCFFCSGIFCFAGSSFLFYANRGLGFKGYPNPTYVETNSLAPLVNFLSAIVYFLKAMDYASLSSSSPGFALSSFSYLDYVFTCPIIVLDLCITLRMRYRILFTIGTAVCLTLATLTTLAESPRSYYYFLFGCFNFVVLFLSLARTIRYHAWPKIPMVARPSVRASLVTFFGTWPLFPVLWLMGPHAGSIISPTVTTILHGILDVACKSVYSIFLLRARLFTEDWLVEEGLLDVGVDQQADNFREQLQKLIYHNRRGQPGEALRSWDDEDGAPVGLHIPVLRRRGPRSAVTPLSEGEMFKRAQEAAQRAVDDAMRRNHSTLSKAQEEVLAEMREEARRYRSSMGDVDGGMGPVPATAALLALRSEVTAGTAAGLDRRTAVTALAQDAAGGGTPVEATSRGTASRFETRGSRTGSRPALDLLDDGDGDVDGDGDGAGNYFESVGNMPLVQHGVDALGADDLASEARLGHELALVPFSTDDADEAGYEAYSAAPSGRQLVVRDEDARSGIAGRQASDSASRPSTDTRYYFEEVSEEAHEAVQGAGGRVGRSRVDGGNSIGSGATEELVPYQRDGGPVRGGTNAAAGGRRREHGGARDASRDRRQGRSRSRGRHDAAQGGFVQGPMPVAAAPPFSLRIWLDRRTCRDVMLQLSDDPAEVAASLAHEHGLSESRERKLARMIAGQLEQMSMQHAQMGMMQPNPYAMGMGVPPMGGMPPVGYGSPVMQSQAQYESARRSRGSRSRSRGRGADRDDEMSNTPIGRGGKGAYHRSGDETDETDDTEVHTYRDRDLMSNRARRR